MGGDSMCPGQPLGTSLFTLASGPGPKITLFEAREFLHAFLDPPEPVRPAQPGPALVHGFAAGRLGDLRRIARTVPQGRPDTRRAGGLAFPPRPGRVRAGVAAPGAALGRPHPPHHPATATLADRPEPRRAGPALPADDRHAPVGLGPAQRQGPRHPLLLGHRTAPPGGTRQGPGPHPDGTARNRRHHRLRAGRPAHRRRAGAPLPGARQHLGAHAALATVAQTLTQTCSPTARNAPRHRIYSTLTGLPAW